MVRGVTSPAMIPQTAWGQPKTGFAFHRLGYVHSLGRKGESGPTRSKPMAAKRFEPRPQLVAEARAFVRDHIRGTARAEDIELAASELATNAIRHAMTPFELSIHVAPQRIRLEVTDASPVIPVLVQTAGPRHGLHIVDQLAEQWGIREIDGGKTVWAEFSTG
jgi:hypothetical protein